MLKLCSDMLVAVLRII